MIRVVVLALLLCGALSATDGRERIGRAIYDAGAPRLAAFLLGGAAWRGAALYGDGRYPEAAESFTAAAFPGQLYDLGGALARSGKLKEAAETFDAALARDPNDEDARYNLALVERLIARRLRGDAPDAANAANSRASEVRRSNTDMAEEKNGVDSTGDGAIGDRDSGKTANAQSASQAPKTGRETQAASDSRKASGSIGTAGGLGRSGDAYMNVSKPPEQPALRSESMMYKTIYASPQWLQTLPDDPGVYVRRLFAQQRVSRKAQGVMAPEMTDAW